jgi:hypothetical protein
MSAPSVALDTRNPLGLRGKIDPLGWSIPSNLPEAEWIKAGRSLGRAERSVMWWIGDWWAFGVHKYGDRRAIVEADGWEGPAYGTWGRFGIRVKSSHNSGGCASRARLVISPTMPRLARPAILA